MPHPGGTQIGGLLGCRAWEQKREKEEQLVLKPRLLWKFI